MGFLSIGWVPGFMIALGAIGSLLSSIAVCVLSLAPDGQ